LSDCTVGKGLGNGDSGGSKIALYNGECPAPDMEDYFNLNWVDQTAFNMKVFKFDDAKVLEIECTVKIYGMGEDSPQDCAQARVVKITYDM